MTKACLGPDCLIFVATGRKCPIHCSCGLCHEEQLTIVPSCGRNVLHILGHGWLTLGAAGRKYCYADQLTSVLSLSQNMLNLITPNHPISGLKIRPPHADHVAIVLSCCQNVREMCGTKWHLLGASGRKHC
jgi:hypothetical protein